MMIKFSEKSQIYIILLFSLLFIVISGFIQPTIEFNNGLGWDGEQYSFIYDFFENKHIDYEKIIFPFNQRIGAPFLAHFLPFDIFTAFKIINLTSFGLGIILLLRKWKIHSLSLLFIFFLIITPQLPFRLTLFYPVQVDGIMFLYYTLVITCFNKPQWVFLFSFFFLPFKESTILINFMYFLSLIIYNFLIYKTIFNKKILLYTTTLLSCFLMLYSHQYFIHIFFNTNNFESSFKTILMWMKTYLLDYKFYIRLIACLFVVFGPLLFFYWKKILADRANIDQKFIFISMLGCILIFSGSDITRILCICLLFVMDAIMDTKKTNVELSILKTGLILASIIKFPYLIMKFDNHMTIGEGFFIMQPEYINSIPTLLSYISVGILSITVPYFYQKNNFQDND